MAFLTPLALLFAALSIPILLLYMLKLRRRDVLVSSTLLWNRLLRDREANAPWQRLRRNLLMLLQLLILVLLTVALARPFLPTPTVAGGSVVILLDASASMQATDVEPTRFEAARRAAREIVAGLGADETATLIGVGPRPDVLMAATSDRAALYRALNRAAPADGPADWPAAAALAAAALRPIPGAQAVVISDGGVPQGLPALPGEVHFVSVGERTDNLAIVALAIRESTAGPRAFLRVANFGDEAATAEVELRADGGLFDVRALDVPARGSASLPLGDLPYDLTLLEARLAGEDPLPLDDRAWAVRSPTGERRVLLVTPGNLFLERALGILPGLEVTRVSPGQPLPAEPFDLIVRDGPITGTLPAGNLWAIGPYGEATTVFTATDIIRVAAQHPVMRYVDLDEVNVLRAWHTDPPPGAQVLVEAQGGPLLYLAERPEGRLAVLAFNLQDSDLPLRVAFPILTANLAGWLLPQGGVGEAASARPGEAVPIRPVPDAERIVVTTPDDREHVLQVGERLPAFAATGRLGVYRVEQFGPDGEFLRSDPLVVNLFSPGESDIAPRDAIQVGQAEVEVDEQEEVGRREFWPWLAAAALVVLGIEWWAYQRGFRVRRVGREAT